MPNFSFAIFDPPILAPILSVFAPAKRSRDVNFRWMGDNDLDCMPINPTTIL